jgi:peroxiredoxin
MQTYMIIFICLLPFSPVSLEGTDQETAGVGIALAKDGEYLVVNSLLPDAPAASSKAIHVRDRIIAVAQGNGPDVRVKGFGIVEVVRLVRGPKGTTVRLTIVPAKKDEREAYVVSLVRGELKELARWGDGELLKSGTKAPNIQLLSLDGQTKEQLVDYAGKIVILEFWSISCGPCQGKMAELQSYPDKYPEWKDKVVLIGASNDDDEDAVIKHVKTKRWDKTHNVRIRDEAVKAYHVNALPTVYIIDQGGNVVDSDHFLNIPTNVNRLVHGK